MFRWVFSGRRQQPDGGRHRGGSGNDGGRGSRSGGSHSGCIFDNTTTFSPEMQEALRKQPDPFASGHGYVRYEIHLHPTYQAPCLWFSLHDLPVDERALDVDTVFRRLVPPQFKEALRASIGGIGGISVDVSVPLLPPLVRVVGLGARSNGIDGYLIVGWRCCTWPRSTMGSHNETKSSSILTHSPGLFVPCSTTLSRASRRFLSTHVSSARPWKASTAPRRTT